MEIYNLLDVNFQNFTVLQDQNEICLKVSYFRDQKEVDPDFFRKSVVLQ